MDCCKHTSKQKKCIRVKDKKVFTLPRKFSKSRCIYGKINGYSMRSSCAPYRYCKKLPSIRKIDTSKKKHKYKLSNTFYKRKLAINEGIRTEAKKQKKSLKQAAISKKARFNILRIYRRYKNRSQCRKITKDMRYINSKYKLNKTKDICGVKKGGTNNTKKIKKTFLYNPDNPKKVLMYI